MGRIVWAIGTCLLLLGSTAAWSEPLLASVKSFLDSEAWRYEAVAKSDAVRMRYRGQTETWVVLVQAREDLRQLSFYSMVPVEIPADRIDVVGEYLHRANYGLAIGCFEFDYDARQVRFRTAIDVEESELSSAQMRNYLYMNVLTCERYLSGLQEVIAGEASPPAAVAAVEAVAGEERDAALPNAEGEASAPAEEYAGRPLANPESLPRSENQ